MSLIQTLRDALYANPVWEQVFDHNPAIQLVIDPAGSVIIDANPAACGFYGYPREVMRGLMLKAIEVEGGAGVSGDDDSSRIAHEHRLSSGAVRLVRLMGAPLHVEGLTVMHLIVFDVTERRRLRVILDSMTEAVIYSEITPDGVFDRRYLNRSMMQMLGFVDEHSDDIDTQQNTIQRMDMSFYPGMDWAELQQAALNVLKRGGVFQRTLSHRGPDGMKGEFQVTSSRVDDAEGRLIGAVTVLRDVSEACALERQRSRFLARASHELRTPITNLKTRLYLLRRQADRLPQDLPVLEQVTTQMSRLVETLLELSRLERGDVQMQWRRLHLQKMIADAAEAHRPSIDGRGQTLHVQLSETPIILQGDPDRLSQVINNLLANASTYTAPGGTITVRLSQQGEMTLPYACLEVLDNGIGIPEDHLEDIFKPFHRVNEGGDGVGLGLSITREIVHLHNGTIRVQSKLGEGSRFIVMLPLLPVL